MAGTMTNPPELSRIVRIDSIGDAPLDMRITAEPTEREALARRFGLSAVESLDAELQYHREGTAIFASGRLRAKVVQTCVASGVPLPVTVDEPFRLRFRPEGEVEAAGEEIELSADDCDDIGYEGGAVDLGEAVAETLLLGLDPFPRAPNADEVLRSAGVLSEGEAGPFAELKALRDKLSGKGKE